MSEIRETKVKVWAWLIHAKRWEFLRERPIKVKVTTKRITQITKFDPLVFDRVTGAHLRRRGDLSRYRYELTEKL